MNREALINKIEKLLSLAGNNPNEAEAKAAMAKAQKLIAEYNIDENLIGKEKDEIVVLKAEHPNNNGYRTRLAAVLAPNFRCRVIMVGTDVHFIGHKVDAEVCVKVFNYAYKISRRQGSRIERNARKNGESTHGVFNSYCIGFCDGIKEVLDEQCKALMIIVPEDVNDKLNDMAKGRYKGGIRLKGADKSAYLNGVEDGKSHMRSKQLEV